MAALPQIPVVNAGALYINGLGISNNSTTPNTKIDVAAGACRNSTNVNDIVVSNTVTISMLANGAGGLDTGSIAADTLYAVYAIGSSSNQLGNGQPFSAFPGTAIVSASFTTPVLPAGYDMFRRIGAIRTDANPHVVKFYQVGSGAERTMWYDVAIEALNGGASAAYAAVDLSDITPAIATNVLVHTVLTPTAASDNVNLRYTGSASVNGQAMLSGEVAGVVTDAVLVVPQSAAASIDYKVVGAVTLNVAGYVDQL